MRCGVVSPCLQSPHDWQAVPPELSGGTGGHNFGEDPMKHCPSGVRALAVASAALSIAVVVSHPSVVARRRRHGFRRASTTAATVTAAPAALLITASSTTASYSTVGNTISYTYSVTNTGAFPEQRERRGRQTAPSGPTTARCAKRCRRRRVQRCHRRHRARPGSNVHRGLRREPGRYRQRHRRRLGDGDGHLGEWRHDRCDLQPVDCARRAEPCPHGLQFGHDRRLSDLPIRLPGKPSTSPLS